MSAGGANNISDEDDQLDERSSSAQHCNELISNEVHIAQENQNIDNEGDDDLESTTPVCRLKRRRKLNIATSATKKLSAAVKAFLASRNSKRNANSVKTGATPVKPPEASNQSEIKNRNPLLTSLIQSPLHPAADAETKCSSNSETSTSKLNWPSNKVALSTGRHEVNQLASPFVVPISGSAGASNPKTPSTSMPPSFGSVNVVASQISTTVMPILVPVNAPPKASLPTKEVPVLPQTLTKVMPTLVPVSASQRVGSSMPTLAPVTSSPRKILSTKVIPVPLQMPTTVMPTLVPESVLPIATPCADAVSNFAVKQSTMPVLSKQSSSSKDLPSAQNPLSSAASIYDIGSRNRTDAKCRTINANVQGVNAKVNFASPTLPTFVAHSSLGDQTGINSKQPVMTLYMKKSPNGQFILTQAIPHVKCSVGIDPKQASTITSRSTIPLNIGGTLGKIPTVYNAKEVTSSAVVPGPQIQHVPGAITPNRHPCIVGSLGIPMISSPRYASCVRQPVPTPSTPVHMSLCQDVNGGLKINSGLPQNEIEACKIWARQTRRCFLRSEQNETHIAMKQAICWSKMTPEQKMPFIKDAQRIQEEKMTRQHNVIEIPRPLHYDGPTTVNPFISNLIRASNAPVNVNSTIKDIMAPTGRHGNTNAVVNTSNGPFQLHNIVSRGSNPARITLQWKPVTSKGQEPTQAPPANLISIPERKVPQSRSNPVSPTTRIPNSTLVKMMRGATYVADHPDRFISDRFLRKVMSDDAYDIDDLLEDAERGTHWRGRGPDIVPNWLVDFVSEYDSKPKNGNKTPDSWREKKKFKTPLKSELANTVHGEKQTIKVDKERATQKTSLTSEGMSGTDRKTTVTATNRKLSPIKEKESATNERNRAVPKNDKSSTRQSTADDSSFSQCPDKLSDTISSTDISAEDLDDLGDIDLIPDNVMWNMCIRLFPDARRVRLWRDNTEELERFLDNISGNNGTGVKVGVEADIATTEESDAKNNDKEISKPDDNDGTSTSKIETVTLQSSILQQDNDTTGDHTDSDKDCINSHTPDTKSPKTAVAAQTGVANTVEMTQNADDVNVIKDPNIGNSTCNTSTTVDIKDTQKSGESHTPSTGQCDMVLDQNDKRIVVDTQKCEDVDTVILIHDKETLRERDDCDDWELIDESMMTNFLTKNSNEMSSDPPPSSDLGLTMHWPTNAPNPNSNVLNAPRPSPSRVHLSIERTPGLSYVDYENIPTCSNDFTYGKPISITGYEEKCKPPKKKWQLRLAAPTTRKKRTKTKPVLKDQSVVTSGKDTQCVDDVVDIGIAHIKEDKQVEAHTKDDLNSCSTDKTTDAGDGQVSSIKTDLCVSDVEAVKNTSPEDSDGLAEKESIDGVSGLTKSSESCKQQSDNLVLTPTTMRSKEDVGLNSPQKLSPETAQGDKATIVPVITPSEKSEDIKKLSCKKIRQQPKRRKCSTCRKRTDVNLNESKMHSSRVSSTKRKSKKGETGIKELKAAFKKVTGRRSKRYVDSTANPVAKSATCENEAPSVDCMENVRISDDMALAKNESTEIIKINESANNEDNEIAICKNTESIGSEKQLECSNIRNTETSTDMVDKIGDGKIKRNEDKIVTESIQEEANEIERNENNLKSCKGHEKLSARSEGAIECIEMKHTKVIRAKSEDSTKIRTSGDVQPGRLRTRHRCVKGNVQDDDRKQTKRKGDTDMTEMTLSTGDFPEGSPRKRNRGGTQKTEVKIRSRTRSSTNSLELQRLASNEVKNTDKRGEEKTTRRRSCSRGEPAVARCYATRGSSKKTRRK